MVSLNIIGAVAVVLLFFSCANTLAEKIQPGMSEEEVINLLGKPDRKAVLIGKILRDFDKVPPEDRNRLRLVYLYDASGLQIWFETGKVTGITQYGLTIR